MLQGEHSAILLTIIKLPFVIKIVVLSIFEWMFYTGFTVYHYFIWALRARKPLLHVKNKGADQPTHTHSLISAVVTHFLKSIITLLAASKITML